MIYPISLACQYLRNPLALREISEKCGYANQYYFSTSSFSLPDYRIPPK